MRTFQNEYGRDEEEEEEKEIKGKKKEDWRNSFVVRLVLLKIKSVESYGYKLFKLLSRGCPLTFLQQ